MGKTVFSNFNVNGYALFAFIKKSVIAILPILTDGCCSKIVKAQISEDGSGKLRFNCATKQLSRM